MKKKYSNKKIFKLFKKGAEVGVYNLTNVGYKKYRFRYGNFDVYAYKTNFSYDVYSDHNLKYIAFTVPSDKHKILMDKLIPSLEKEVERLEKQEAIIAVEQKKREDERLKERIISMDKDLEDFSYPFSYKKV